MKQRRSERGQQTKGVIKSGLNLFSRLELPLLKGRPNFAIPSKICRRWPMLVTVRQQKTVAKRFAFRSLPFFWLPSVLQVVSCGRVSGAKVAFSRAKQAGKVRPKRRIFALEIHCGCLRRLSYLLTKGVRFIPNKRSVTAEVSSGRGLIYGRINFFHAS